MSQNPKYFILTGDPGVGKTTLIKKLCSLLNDKGVKTMGFFTEEVRGTKGREGFDIVTLDGNRGRLARDKTKLLMPAKFSVGKYNVLVEEFENVAMPAIEETEDASVVLVIDEIGRMENFSTKFTSRLKNILSQSPNFILATIPSKSNDPLIETIRKHNKAKIWVINKENRDVIHKDIVHAIMTAMNL